MSTISGKRFQITDGASTPTNLFPYTVTEAVYGLSTVIENAKTAVTSVLSAVTLNGVSKAGTTASFYAPTTAGTTGQILKATTSGAPVWTSAALGASNKPIYLNSSGVLTEGVSCLPLTGGTLSNAAWGGALIINRAEAGGESAIKFTSNGTLVGVIGVKAEMTPVFYPGNETSGNGHTIYHSGNSNKSDVSWTAGALTSNGYVTFYNSSSHKYRINANFSSAVARFYACNDAATSMCDIQFGSPTTANSLYYQGSTGNVGIGTASPSYTLDVNGGARARNLTLLWGASRLYLGCSGGVNYIQSGNADFTANANLVVCGPNTATGSDIQIKFSTATFSGTITSTGDQVVSSDLTLKTNLTPVAYSVADIAKARAVEFDWRDGRGHSMGSIAQDWLSIAPALVHGEEGNMSLAYGQLALVNTILLAREIMELKKENAELKEEVKRLRMN